MNSMDFWVKGSEVKITLTLYVKTLFEKYLNNSWALYLQTPNIDLGQ
jgi:hypothetical protein